MVRFIVLFVVGVSMIGALAAGPTLFKPQQLSAVSSKSVRVQSLPPPRPVIVTSGRSSSSSWGSSSSGRYSSGGGFSSGK